MGNFYVNYTLRCTDREAVAKALMGRSAVITPAENESVVVFDEESDEQDQDTITELASDLSRNLDCAVLAVLNHDDDVLWYQLYTTGDLADEYDSSPSYFDPEAEPSDPAGGNAQTLCRAFESSNVAEVESILRRSSFDEGGYAFAFERHADLARALGIPSFGVGAGYCNFADGEIPDGLDKDELIKVT